MKLITYINIHRNRILLAGLAIGFLLVSFFALKEPDVGGKDVFKIDRPDFIFDDVKITQIDGDRMNWILEASSAEIDKGKQRAVLKYVNGELLHDAKKQVYFSAPIANYDMNSELLDLWKTTALFFVSKETINMKSDYLNWDAKTELLHGEGNVRLFTKDIIITGQVFDTEVPIQKLRVLKNAVAEIKIYEDTP